MPAAGWKKLSDEEIRLARKWFKEDDLEPSEIAIRRDRDKSTLTRLLVKAIPRRAQGRREILSRAKIDFLQRRLEQMIIKSRGRYHVTITMLKKKTKCKARPRNILDLSGAYVKPKKTLSHNTGARSSLVIAGVGNGRVLMWHQVAKSRWNGAAAVEMYGGPLQKALTKVSP